MIFNTWLFALFAVIVFTTYWTIGRRLRPIVLMLAGLVFYSASIPVYTLLVLALGLISYVSAMLLLRYPPRKYNKRRKWILSAGILSSVGVLAFFKYTKFLASSFSGICSGGCIHTLPDLVVPLAVSFFTFEFVHVLVDVYIGKISLIRARDFAAFTLFFPTMVAGPIKRYQNFVPQIDRVNGMSQLVFASGIYRVALGLAKKLIIADSMTPFVQPLLAPAPIYTSANYWVGVLAYTTKIYFDFTGYSDIAIGLSALLGYQILENFDRPYWAPNISQFWRRWHMSLSSWIRDYLFIPLGGSRQSRLKTSINLGVVMALAGLWHGAAWHFVVWGLWHGLGLAVHGVWSKTIGKSLNRVFGRFSLLLTATSIATTFLFVALGWVLFASPSLKVAADVYARLFVLKSNSADVSLTHDVNRRRGIAPGKNRTLVIAMP